jgi:16S rRNA (guanine527-N7)-methyltransferase
VIDLLIRSAGEMGATLSPAQATLLIQLLDELDDWNQRMNLTAIRDRSQQITKHLLDSLSIHSYLRGTNIADVGTGAGFPGLPLALVNPDKQFTLIDSVNKKLKFVEHAAQLMGLTNVATLHVRAESFKAEKKFDCIVARAVGPVARLIAYAGHNLASGAKLLAMKGKHPQEELEVLPNGWKVANIHRLHIPALDEERHLVEIWRSYEKEKG